MHPKDHEGRKAASARLLSVGAAALLVLLISCTKHLTDNPVPEQPPRTFLWLFPDSTVGVGVSRQHLSWWGDDPNGLVRGFLFAFAIEHQNVRTLPVPDTLRYTWVTGNDTTILFPLDTLFRYFLVAVRAVDNQFVLPQGFSDQSVVRLTPFAYWDRNDDGVYDNGDVALPGLLPATDPTGAVLTFPVRNSPPSVSWVLNPIDPLNPLRVPDTTYPAVTFSWTATDPDGNNTLKSYRIALNDTTNPANWVTIPLRDTIITLFVPRVRSDAAGPGAILSADLYAGDFLGRQPVGQINGLRLDALNVFYLEVQDVAGEYSPAITLPSGTDHWYVKRPQGTLLLVSDYLHTIFDANAAIATYHSALAGVGGQFTTIDQLDLDLGLTAVDKLSSVYGRLVPPFSDPALIFTFLLYDYVLWYTDQYPTLDLAQLSLFTYLSNGGKVVFSTIFQNTIDPRGALRDFAPIDSVSGVDLSPGYTTPSLGDTRIPASSIVYADSSDLSNIYPQLAFNSSPVNHSIFMRPIYRRFDARYVYHLQADARNPIRYLGAPNLGVVDGQGRIVFMGVPLHLLNNTVQGNPLGLTAFFTKIFTQHFSPLQKVNRRKF